MRPGDIYDALFDDEAYAALPEMIARLVGGRAGVIYRIDNFQNFADFHYSYYSSGIMDDLHRYGTDIDMWGQAGKASGVVNRAISVDRLVPEAAFRKSPFYNEILRPHGDDTGHCVGIITHHNSGMICTAVHRAFSAGAFDEQAEDLLNGMGNDLHRIYRARELFREKEQRINNLSDLLHASAENIILVDAQLRLIEASPDAIALIEKTDGIALSRRHLRFAPNELERAVRKAVTDTIHRRPPERTIFRVHGTAPDTPLDLFVLPAHHGDRSHAMLVIKDGRVHVDRMRGWLLECANATSSEASVALALVEGKAPEEISQAREVSISTVRTQIRRLLEKTDTQSITQLVRKLAQIG